MHYNQVVKLLIMINSILKIIMISILLASCLAKPKGNNPMTENIFLEEYNNESVDELILLSKSHRIDSIVTALESALLNKANGNILHPFSKSEKVVVVIEDFEREINNGGFSQYFSNSPLNTLFIVNCLNEINCNKTSAIVKQAIGLLNLNTIYSNTNFDPEDAEEIFESIEEAAGNDEIQDKLEKLEGQILNDYEAIADKLFEYVKINKSDINLK